MSAAELAITIAIIAVGTMLTRYLPFIVFSGRRTPEFVRYLGRVLPPAAIGLLVVYCFKDIELATGAHGAYEIGAALATCAIHVAFRKTLLSIAAGTAIYVALVNLLYI